MPHERVKRRIKNILNENADYISIEVFKELNFS